LIHPVREHREAYQRLESAINGLTSRRPRDVTREEWSYIVGWTMNGIGNCCAVREYLHDDSGSHQRFVAFVNDLELKVQGDVTIETIYWIWDQFVLVSRHGERYARNYRPTTSERLEESAYISTGIEVQ
jgi:hypothetical protein